MPFNSRGFSLLELMVTLIIVTILITLTVPSFITFSTQSKNTIIGKQLLRAINLARSEAQLRGVPVTLCKSRDHISCSGQWQDGQIIFIDDGSNTILEVFKTPRTKSVLHWQSSLNKDYLRLFPSGSTHNTAGTFWLCNQEGKIVWKIIVSRQGRARWLVEDKFT